MSRSVQVVYCSVVGVKLSTAVDFNKTHASYRDDDIKRLREAAEDAIGGEPSEQSIGDALPDC
mgnify:CR=1